MKINSPGSTPIYVTVLFVICLVTLIGTAISNYQNLQRLKIYSDAMEHTWGVKYNLKNINLLLMDAESGVRGYFLSNDDSLLRPLAAAQSSLPKEFKTLEELVIDNPAQQKELKQLRVLFDGKLKKMEEGIHVYQDGGLAETVKIMQLTDGKDSMDEVRLLDIVMEKDELELLTARRTYFYKEYNRALLVSMLINALATVSMLIFYRLITGNFNRRREIENELKEANDNLESTVLRRTEQLSVLSRHLLKVAEEEKAKLARELHDEMGSSLTAVSMDISMLIEKMKKIDPGMVDQLRRAKQTLLDTVNMKRRIIEDLRPSMLDHLGLPSSIRSHYEKIGNIANLAYDTDIDDGCEDIDPATAIALFRIAQESLNNIVKYAKATNVHLSLKKSADGLCLRIADDGIGIAADALIKPKSHGLLGMRERALLLGGRFSVTSSGEHKGTTVEAFIPVQS